MGVQVLFLIGALVAGWLLLNWFKRAQPAAVRKIAMMAAFGLLALVGLWLVLTGKLAGLFAVIAGLSPWIMRAARLHGLWRMLRQMGVQMKGGQASGGQTTRVETFFLRMELDHDSSRLDGQVVAGTFSGRRLSELTEMQARALLQEVGADQDSVRVLQSWLDRAWPDWRGWDQTSERAQPPSTGSGAMTEDEARSVLGVDPGADEAEIRAAHRRLMLANHPDHGGSAWIAARVNQARDILLKATGH